MNTQGKKAPGANAQARRKRQAEALRANLTRRKSQDRARAEENGDEQPTEPAARLAPEDE